MSVPNESVFHPRIEGALRQFSRPCRGEYFGTGNRTKSVLGAIRVLPYGDVADRIRASQRHLRAYGDLERCRFRRAGLLQFALAVTGARRGLSILLAPESHCCLKPVMPSGRTNAKRPMNL